MKKRDGAMIKELMDPRLWRLIVCSVEGGGLEGGADQEFGLLGVPWTGF